MDTQNTPDRINFVTIAAGICFVAFGVLLLLQTNGLLDLRTIVKLWPVALIIIGSAVVVQAIRGQDALRSLPIGGLIWIALLGIVLSHAFDRRASAGDAVVPGEVNIFAVMGGGDRKPTFSGSFRGGRITAVMGGGNLDLRQATLAPGETAVVDVFAVMGGTVIRVPSGWDVDMEAVAIMAGANASRDLKPAPVVPSADGTVPLAAPHLIVRGSVIMGGVTVKP